MVVCSVNSLCNLESATAWTRQAKNGSLALSGCRKIAPGPGNARGPTYFESAMSEAKADKIKESIAALEMQRSTLGDAVVDSAIAALREQLSQLRPDADKGATLDERKLVTILFADIAGFTALSEKLDPEEVRRLINACFDRLVPIVQKYGGTIDKFIGDEIMALFGAPIAHEDDPERALWVALEMFEAINVFNRRLANIWL